MENTFLGAMIWYTGVVESVNDPQELGRVRVRCYGYHTPNKNQLPTEDLPWATPVMPVTSASMSGVGISATGLEPGSWVVGFFRDGQSAQDPVILGSIPSRTFSPSNEDESFGFSDPDRVNPRISGAPDIPQMATSTYEENNFYVEKKALRHTNVPAAVKPNLTIDNNPPNEERPEWNMLDVEEETVPIYPFNHVTEYSSGHLIEIDETPLQERLNRTHASGTYEEITAGGDRSVVVKAADYEVVFNDKNVYIKGNCHLTVDQDVRMLVKGDYNLEVEGDYNLNVKGSYKRKIGANELGEIGQDQNINISENKFLRVGNDNDDMILGNEQRMVKGDSGQFEIISKNRDLVVGGENSQLSKGNTVVESNRQYNMTSKGNFVIDTGASGRINASGTIRVNASQIHLN